MKPSIPDILAEALRHQPAERDAYIDAACRGDEAAAREVRSLIAAMANAGVFLAASTN